MTLPPKKKFNFCTTTLTLCRNVVERVLTENLHRNRTSCCVDKIYIFVESQMCWYWTFTSNEWLTNPSLSRDTPALCTLTILPSFLLATVIIYKCRASFFQKNMQPLNIVKYVIMFHKMYIYSLDRLVISKRQGCCCKYKTRSFVCMRNTKWKRFWKKNMTTPFERVDTGLRCPLSCWPQGHSLKKMQHRHLR